MSFRIIISGWVSLMFFLSCQNQEELTTYERDIKPIIRKNCSGCHNPEGFAPFNLLTYKDVSKRAAMIVEVTQSGYMPPWYADTTFNRFANQRHISQLEIETIKSWIADGKPKGALFTSSIKVKQSNKLLQLNTISLSPKRPIEVKGDNQEHFIKVIIPFENEKEIPIQGISYKPANRKYAHHSNYAIFKLPEQTSLQKFYPPFEAGINDSDLSLYQQLFTNQVHYSGWVPGSSPINFGEGNGFVLPKKGVVLLTLHYASAPIDFTDLPKINFYKAEEKIQHLVKTISLGSGGIGHIEPELIIPPNVVSKFSLRENIPIPIEVLYVWPHMHFLGKSFKAQILGPENDTVPLVRINKWDFDWQEGYQLLEPLSVERGSKILIEAEYDNTSQNPRNPNSPPQMVNSTGFMESEKEMMTLVLIYRDKLKEK